MVNRLFAVAALICLNAAGADDLPGWLRDAAEVKLPQFPGKVKKAVLLDEERTTVMDSGKLVSITHGAVKILVRQGVELHFAEQYDTGGGKVRDFRAWMIAPSGKVKKYGKEEILDVACAANDIYNECRMRMVSGNRDAEVGAIFAYEATVERQIYSNQVRFHFQDSSPVVMSRFVLTAPAGWDVKPVSFNGAPEKPEMSGGSYTWRMENLAALETEPASPSFLTVTPWVGANLTAPGRTATSTWRDIAKQLWDLNEGQAEPNDAMTAKAKALVEGATSEFEKIRAIGRYTQQLNYVSIQVNTSKGGGYRPHAAAQTFQKLYGDCKDKANLTRAMLKAVGITAFPVAIYSGDRTHVNAEWPSLGAFNHAITAVRVGKDTNAPAVLDDPKLGRLMFFDPTDPYVRPGYLPDHEQASLALVSMDGAGELVRVPAGAAMAKDRQRQVKAVLKADGSISGSFVDTRTGESLERAVAVYRGSQKPDYIRMIERWVANGIPGGATSNIDAKEGPGEFVLKGDFASLIFAQQPQAGMMVFPAALLYHGEIRLTEKKRKYPVVLATDALSETVEIELPAGVKVDELPPALNVTSPFGKYEASWTAADGLLVFKRNIEIPAQTVAANQYADLKKFMDVVANSAHAPVVLLK